MLAPPYAIPRTLQRKLSHIPNYLVFLNCTAFATSLFTSTSPHSLHVTYGAPRCSPGASTEYVDAHIPACQTVMVLCEINRSFGYIARRTLVRIYLEPGSTERSLGEATQLVA